MALGPGELLWRLGELDFRPDELEIPPAAIPVALPVLPALEQTLWEYELMGLSPAQQLMKHYRAGLRARGVRSNGEIKQLEAGQRAWRRFCRGAPATCDGTRHFVYVAGG
ncbi:MAG: hypothetical protein IPK16_23580 [Anaerolineales bacterium]|nr:hypothetical protein [Anaerolineales bacterium]